jgi:hypothetical protein
VKRHSPIRVHDFLVVTLGCLLPLLLLLSCSQAPPQGVYVQEGRKDRTLTLEPDGRFSVQETETPIHGTYRIQGQVLVLITEDGQESRGVIRNNSLVDPQGNRWRKQ